VASNAERLRELFDRFWNHGDWRAGADLFADDIEWHGIDEVGLGAPPWRARSRPLLPGVAGGVGGLLE
jgi:hypothetical protein